MKIFLLFLISLLLLQVFAEPFGVDNTSLTDVMEHHFTSCLIQRRKRSIVGTRVQGGAEKRRGRTCVAGQQSLYSIFKWAHYNERMKIFLLFLISLLLLQVFAEPFGVDNTSLTDGDVAGYGASLYKLPHPKKKTFHCGYACARRCREASRKNVCSRACNACCAKCKCVPPGTYGHKAACPCYAKLRTHGNRSKCP